MHSRKRGLLTVEHRGGTGSSLKVCDRVHPRYWDNSHLPHLQIKSPECQKASKQKVSLPSCMLYCTVTALLVCSNTFYSLILLPLLTLHLPLNVVAYHVLFSVVGCQCADTSMFSTLAADSQPMSPPPHFAEQWCLEVTELIGVSHYLYSDNDWLEDGRDDCWKKCMCVFLFQSNFGEDT